MSESIIREAVFSLHCISVGVLITFVYDLLRVCRICVRHSRFMVSVEDFLFWVVCAIFIFLVLYCENDGILRWYCVAGAVVGMELYKKLFSLYIVHFMSTVLKKTIDMVSWILGKLMFPFKMLFLGLRKGWTKICHFFTKKKKEADR
ncbi:MAG: spore cortex biosynthesis protein YabQ [bacterium]|nr:spore cortex biosynthesis protein YabQ [bacterium]